MNDELISVIADVLCVADAIKLGTVAGRQDDCFFGRTTLRQIVHGVRQACRSKGQLFAYAQRRSLVIESDGGQLHGIIRMLVCVGQYYSLNRL